MKYYLVDFENTGVAGLRGVGEIKGESVTAIFYSCNADKITFDMHCTLAACKSRIVYQKVMTGEKNALDFQLSTFLGYLIHSGKSEDAFYIVSKDNGYRTVADFWEGKNIRMVDSIAHSFVLDRQKDIKTDELRSNKAL